MHFKGPTEVMDYPIFSVYAILHHWGGFKVLSFEFWVVVDILQ